MDKASTLTRLAALAFIGLGLGGCGFPAIREVDPATLENSDVPVCNIETIKNNAMSSVTECRPPISLALDRTPPLPLSKEELARNRALAKQACREDRRFCFR